jgi:uncharacterized protein
MPLQNSSVLPRNLGANATSITQKINTLNWPSILQSLENQGFSTLNSLLSPMECRQLSNFYNMEERFRSRIIMQRYRFGRGEYQYFAYPLPTIVQTLRERIYPQLTSLANRWNKALGIKVVYPDQLHDFLDLCHQSDQTRPTPLLLKYEEGDFNCLHQDLYGELSFPLQVAIVLNEPGQDFSGGEFVLSEQKARSQSQVHVLNLHQGDAVIFAVSHRPVQGVKGIYRVNLKHGISSLHAGQRYCLGIIFHDAA